ncbi:SURP and G-patch domain-containing protein 1-like protein [Rutidosis leptorrhynchoides]|uniref:SURP and G-patch domain-containing protein 1-like protein n=1 Tax=Rutidosis leptorrhynchoides TaxID=125765 RepID=UPI003A98DE53
MEKERLFVNDGSFMERFKQLQQAKDLGHDLTVSESPKPKPVISTSGSKASNYSKNNKTPSSGKLAFSLKQKSKLVAPAIKLSEDEEEEDEKDAGKTSAGGSIKRQKLDQFDSYDQTLTQVVAPQCPSDPAVKKAAERLASFVAKNGKQIEHVTRQKNPGDTPFKFLFDESCADYKYYEYLLNEEEKALAQTMGSQITHTGTTKPTLNSSSQRSHQPHPNYQTPASALYDATDSAQSDHGETNAPSASDPIAMMEYYMKKAAREEKRRQPKYSKDEMPPPASLQQGSGKRGHHMGDYIPLEELDKFMASCNDVAAQKAAKEAAEKARIQADNVGHRLLSKMGWKEGEGLGSSSSGIADPIMAGSVKKDNLGVGASKPGEVTPDDDIYEQYKKRMMLGYKHRPNPLGNPRKAYY